MQKLIKQNRMGVLLNPIQNKEIEKVLTVCSAGCLRSPTAAHILASPPWNFNTRCCGLSEEYAIVPMTRELVFWADSIVVMEEWMVHPIMDTQNELARAANEFHMFSYAPIHCLDIPDEFAYRDPKLVKLLTAQFLDIYPIGS